MSEDSRYALPARSGEKHPSPLRIAFGIYSLAVRGGLEDQCIRLARELGERGHQVTLFCVRATDPLPSTVVQLSPRWRPLSNHARMQRFAYDFVNATAKGFDRTVTFQPVPHADILFCADMPRTRATIPVYKRLSRRHRIMASLEAGVFGIQAKTRIICLARPQAEAYIAAHATPPARVPLMPPSVDVGRRQPERRSAGNRADRRAALGLSSTDTAWLWLGLQPEIKGLDRAVAALAHHPHARLLVGGLSSGDRKAQPILRLAAAAGVKQRIQWLGYLSGDLWLDTMAAADMLVHPARVDVTGAVILEALINGLPVVTTSNCGFAEHVTRSGAGLVVDQPFSSDALAAAIGTVAMKAASLSELGIAYGRENDLYTGLKIAADLIEAPIWQTAMPGSEDTISR
ncbi:glycosyltransferase family 4 protein [Mesorhizobium sp. CAU 1732]|uniref:glycosyltransferase family 4 protein n=1 Tax=Mesorhizobium sp. CAU 1732 TaxID=3140358 RepID=UPI003261976F